MRCLDTCIIIDFLRGRAPELYGILQRTNPKLVIVPAIVAAELMTGAERSSDPQEAREAIEEFLLPFQIVPFDMRCANEYARIRAKLEREGQAIGHNDMFIAATALAHDAVLVTNNVREFKRIPTLSLEQWSVIRWGEGDDA